jgi:glyoxylate reductase
MPKNILITREIPQIAVSMLEERGYVVDVNKEGKIPDQQKIIELLRQNPYDAVITLLTDQIDKSIFDASPTVKIFSNYASGYDNIDTNEAKSRGVVVANAPTELSAISVAEHVVGLMIALANRVVEADRFIRSRKYAGWDPMLFLGTDILGKTIAIVGGGRIGEVVARFCNGLGLRIIYTDIVQNKKMEQEYGAVFYKSLEEVLPIADFISLHVPLLSSTKHLINEKTLSLMKPTSFLINTSRGGVIDEVALEKALRGKVIAGAALDVFEFEPKILPGLIELENTVLTPHIASANLDAREAMAKEVAQNIIDFFDGKELKNKVSK